MIVLFARSNHPLGFGFATGYTPGVPSHAMGAHGYSVVGVRCNSIKQRDKVIAHITSQGLDLPDVPVNGYGRNIYPNGKPDSPWKRGIGQAGIIRWYSGGPSDWDYLFTIKGNKIDWPDYFSGYIQSETQSRGDNRFVGIYDAKLVLSE